MYKQIVSTQLSQGGSWPCADVSLGIEPMFVAEGEVATLSHHEASAESPSGPCLQVCLPTMDLLGHLSAHSPGLQRLVR